MNRRMTKAVAILLIPIFFASCASYHAYQKARTAEQEKNWDAAVVEYEKALELNPLNKLLRVRRGDILDRMKDFEAADKEYRDAVDFDPTNAYYLNRFGLHYKRWGKRAEAQALFERAALHPGGRATADLNLRILGPIKGPAGGE